MKILHPRFLMTSWQFIGLVQLKYRLHLSDMVVWDAFFPFLKKKTKKTNRP